MYVRKDSDENECPPNMYAGGGGDRERPRNAADCSIRHVRLILKRYGHLFPCFISFDISKWQGFCLKTTYKKDPVSKGLN